MHKMLVYLQQCKWYMIIVSHIFIHDILQFAWLMDQPDMKVE